MPSATDIQTIIIINRSPLQICRESSLQTNSKDRQIIFTANCLCLQIWKESSLQTA